MSHLSTQREQKTAITPPPPHTLLLLYTIFRLIIVQSLVFHSQNLNTKITVLLRLRN